MQKYFSLNKSKVFLFFAACLNLSQAYGAAASSTTNPFDLSSEPGQPQRSLKVVLQTFETLRYSLEKNRTDVKERNPHSDEFFFAFNKLRAQYGDAFFTQDAVTRDREAVDTITRLADSLDTANIEDGMLHTRPLFDKDGNLIGIFDPLTGAATTTKTVVYTTAQKRIDCKFLLHSMLLQTPAAAIVNGAPPIMDDHFYCSRDGSSHPIGRTGITIREGMWLIMQAIADDAATTPDGNQFARQQKLEGLLNALCDMANDYPALQTSTGTIKSRKSTCVKGARRNLAICLNGLHPAFYPDRNVDQTALATQKLSSIQVLGKSTFEAGLAAARIEHMAIDQEVEVGGKKYKLAELSSFSDVLMLVRQMAYEELLTTRGSRGEAHSKLSDFSLEVRLLAATSIINTAAEKLSPRGAFSLLDNMLSHDQEQTCIGANPDLATYGQFATAGFAAEDDANGELLCIVHHARQVLKTFGLCPGLPGANLEVHLSMLARAAYNRPEPQDPRNWQDVCLPATADITEKPSLKGILGTPLLMQEPASTDAAVLGEINRLILDLVAQPDTQPRVLPLLKWVENEDLLIRLRFIRDDASRLRQLNATQPNGTFNFSLAPADRAERYADPHLTNIGLVMTTMQQIMATAHVSARIKDQARPLLADLERKRNGHNLYDRAVRFLNTLPADICAERFNYPFAPETPAERRDAVHLQNVALVLMKMWSIIDSPNVSDVIRRQIFDLWYALNDKPHGYHKYDAAVRYLNTLPADIV